MSGDSLAMAGGQGERDEPRWVWQATLAFVLLGVLLRAARYAMNYPLWGDEAYLAANLIGRGYRDLLQPLGYGQVCPLLFLWVEHSIVAVLGFSEWSLRLFPALCGMASVPLFCHMAGRVVRGVPLLLAVGIFAISFHPIRHAAEVKPYASDLLVAVGLLELALGWLREPSRSRGLWGLVVLAPVAVTLSLPAVFVAGSVGLGLAAPVWKARRWQVWLPFVLFNLAAAGTFAVVFLAYTGAQNEWTVRGLQAYWAASFPPLGDARKLAGWLVWVHTGTLFAYPGGGQGGASAGTLLLFLIAVGVLWKTRQRTVLALCLGPFGLALLAAALRRFPYGGEARQMQFLAPVICLLAGLGAAAVWRAIPWRQVRAGTLQAAMCLAVLASLGLLARDLIHPYRYLHDHQARQFAREFWPQVARNAEVACLRWDFKIMDPRSLNAWAASYLCNQWIYLPRRDSGGPRWHTVSAEHPLRCVLYNASPADAPLVNAWLVWMTSIYDLRRCERLTVPVDHAPAGRPVVVYEFVPRAPLAGDALAGRPAGSVPR